MEIATVRHDGASGPSVATKPSASSAACKLSNKRKTRDADAACKSCNSKQQELELKKQEIDPDASQATTSS
jgi:hypothetical protein